MTGIIALMLFLAAGHSEATTPDLLRSINPNRQTPLWVALPTAVTSQGELSREYFDQYAIRDLRRAADARRSRVRSQAVDAQPCFGERPAEIGLPSDTIDDLSANASAILKGEIVRRTLGFFEDRPAALLTVRVDRAPRGSIEGQSEIFLYYPEAEFSVGDDTFCIRPATHPARPRVGDSVLIFAYREPVDETGRVIYGQASKHLIFETAAGELVSPVGLQRELSALGIQTLDKILERIGNKEPSVRRTKTHSGVQ